MVSLSKGSIVWLSVGEIVWLKLEREEESSMVSVSNGSVVWLSVGEIVWLKSESEGEALLVLLSHGLPQFGNRGGRIDIPLSNGSVVWLSVGGMVWLTSESEEEGLKVALVNVSTVWELGTSSNSQPKPSSEMSSVPSNSRGPDQCRTKKSLQIIRANSIHDCKTRTK